jgi:hypothetical protein
MSSTNPALSDRGVNRGDAAPTPPGGRPIRSRRTARFGFRLAAHCLRGQRIVGLRYVGVGGRAAFRGPTPLDPVDRTAIFVGPIDRRHEATLAQPSQGGAYRMRKPARHNDQLCNTRAVILLEKFDDLRELRPASRRG